MYHVRASCETDYHDIDFFLSHDVTFSLLFEDRAIAHVMMDHASDAKDILRSEIPHTLSEKLKCSYNG